MEREAKGIGLIGAAPVAAPKPAAPAPTPPAAPVSPQGDEDYEIKKGDTLSGIAKRTGRSVEAITRENKIADPNKIGIGQKIRIPKG
jgi:LysM repeat protein